MDIPRNLSLVFWSTEKMSGRIKTKYSFSQKFKPVVNY